MAPLISLAKSVKNQSPYIFTTHNYQTHSKAEETFVVIFPSDEPIHYSFTSLANTEIMLPEAEFIHQ